MGLIIVVQKSLNKAGIETMNKMRVINRQTGDIFNVKVNPYLPSKASVSYTHLTLPTNREV